MQIDKVGAYHRIPETLAREARRRKTRPLFSSIRLEYINPYRPVQSAISLSGKKVNCHVHAEVQMVIHYILEPASNTPRIIGTSKAACFLCHLFITEHKMFGVSAWHGRLFDQWTIPDLAEYSSANITTLRATIQGMHHKCAQLISTSHPRRPYPLTSRHNLRDLPNFSPASTIPSMRFDQAPSLSRAVSTVAEGHPVSAPSVHASGSPASSVLREPDVSERLSAADSPETPEPSNHALESDVVVESNNAGAPVPETHDLSGGRQGVSSSTLVSSTGVFHLRPGRPRVIEFPHVISLPRSSHLRWGFSP
ncbi:hypothetical protein CLAIMM_13141 isoform 1 [Cladophialophora immunda]|nr:hypothetical protein CLAIMM_13141 isoform 1 [Cladophialophora immunda]